MASFAASIEGAPVSRQAHGDHHQHEHQDGPHLRPQLGEAVALEHDAAHQHEEMRERQRRAEPLRPFRLRAIEKSNPGPGSRGAGAGLKSASHVYAIHSRIQ